MKSKVARYSKLWSLMTALLIVALALAACPAPEPEPEPPPVEEPAPPAEPVEPAAEPEVDVDEWPDFGGITIVATGDAGHNMLPITDFWVEDWEQANLNIELIEVPFEAVYERQKAEFVAGTGAFDLVIFYPAFIGDFASNRYLEPLEPYFDQWDPHLDDVIVAFRELYLKWDGQVYALPYDGDVHGLYYRKDLFEHPDEQARFQEEYGRELVPPRTWDEWLEVGVFFTREPGDALAGETLERAFYGCAEYGQRGFTWAWFMNRFASMGGVYFDEDMNPMINTPDAVAALENMVESVNTCSPPDVLEYGYEELKNVFLNGDVAMVVQWTDVPKKAADPEQSQIVGKVGYTLVPGTMNGDGAVVHRAMMPVGRVLAVAADSEHKEAAYWAAYHLDYVRGLENVSTPLTGLDPYRQSHLDPAAYEMFEDEEDAERYLEAVIANLEVGFPEIYIPGAAQYNDELDLAVSRATAGLVTPQEALDAAAAAWDENTDRLGRERQTELWRSALETYRELGLWQD